MSAITGRMTPSPTPPQNNDALINVLNATVQNWAEEVAPTPEYTQRVTAMQLFYSFTETPNATTLELKDLQLTSLPDIFNNEQFRKLTTLDISKNNLTALPNSLSALENLTKLIVHSNQLQSIDKEILRLPKLEVLNVIKNPDLKLLPGHALIMKPEVLYQLPRRLFMTAYEVQVDRGATDLEETPKERLESYAFNALLAKRLLNEPLRVTKESLIATTTEAYFILNQPTEDFSPQIATTELNRLLNPQDKESILSFFLEEFIPFPRHSCSIVELPIALELVYLYTMHTIIIDYARSHYMTPFDIQNAKTEIENSLPPQSHPDVLLKQQALLRTLGSSILATVTLENEEQQYYSDYDIEDIDN